MQIAENSPITQATFSNNRPTYGALPLVCVLVVTNHNHLGANHTWGLVLLVKIAPNLKIFGNHLHLHTPLFPPP